jgi:2',3'-cyclic-nucleotide 2'-phosphodiesterase/3'-nucleotidase
VKELHEETIRYIQGNPGDEGDKGEVIGSTTSKFQPEDEIRGISEGRLKDTAVIDLIHKVQLLNSGADVSACSLFKSDSDLPEGEIYYKNIFDIYKYDNTLYRINVTGKELKDYMEWSAGFYNQWVPGDINISFDPDFPDYQYDMFAGVDYEIDISKPKGERIQNVMFRGEPLKDDQILKLCVSNFRYSAALKPYKLVSGKADWESSGSIRDMIVDYFRQNSPVEPEIYNNWMITGIDLSTDDPRRKEIIDHINDGSLSSPVNSSYNLKDYDSLIAEAKGGAAAKLRPD